MYPKQDTGVFKILQCLYEKKGATIDEVIAEIGYVTLQRQRCRMAAQFVGMRRRNYVTKDGNVYFLTPELKAYVQDVLEVAGLLEKKDLVAPAYRNIFTPEMRNYNLFQNKRGYS